MKQQERASETSRRNPGRMDGARWNGDQFICTSRVEGPYEDSDHETEAVVDEHEDGDRPVSEAGPVVSLMDYARPAKERGAVIPKYRARLYTHTAPRSCEGVRGD